MARMNLSGLSVGLTVIFAVMLLLVPMGYFATPILGFSMASVIINGLLVIGLTIIAFIDYPHPFYILIAGLVYYFALFKILIGF